jgi:hypothetical protein
MRKRWWRIVGDREKGCFSSSRLRQRVIAVFLLADARPPSFAGLSRLARLFRSRYIHPFIGFKSLVRSFILWMLSD